MLLGTKINQISAFYLLKKILIFGRKHYVTKKYFGAKTESKLEKT